LDNDAANTGHAAHSPVGTMGPWPPTGEWNHDGRTHPGPLEAAMKSFVARVIAAIAVAAGLSACVVYEPVYVGGGTPATYERSWNAAVGAFQDQGVPIAVQDRTNGVIEGRRGGISVKARVVTQADGRVRVEFNTGGALAEDPGLPERMSRAYDARMGRY
jgi:hypothetical protein